MPCNVCRTQIKSIVQVYLLLGIFMDHRIYGLYNLNLNSPRAVGQCRIWVIRKIHRWKSPFWRCEVCTAWSPYRWFPIEIESIHMTYYCEKYINNNIFVIKYSHFIMIIAKFIENMLFGVMKTLPKGWSTNKVQFIRYQTAGIFPWT